MARARTNVMLTAASGIVLLFIITGLYLYATYRPFWIPAGSMKPTLLVGDFVIVDQSAYGRRCIRALCWREISASDPKPERGDVVVFRHPRSGADYIKRVIGMPGDEVQMLDGFVYLNGAQQPQTPAGLFVEAFERQGPIGQYPTCANITDGVGSDCEKELMRESLEGSAVHTILNIRDDVMGDNTDVFVVPEGQFFVMGDNRDNSLDSRMPRVERGVGFVPFGYLVGRAERVLFSSAGRQLGFFWTWRGDRFFKAIQ